MAESDIFQATQSFTAVLNGRHVVIHRGDTLRAGHPLIAGRESLFKPWSGPTFEHRVEQATRRPGEHRDAAPPAATPPTPAAPPAPPHNTVAEAQPSTDGQPVPTEAPHETGDDTEAADSTDGNRKRDVKARADGTDAPAEPAAEPTAKGGGLTTANTPAPDDAKPKARFGRK